VTGVCRDLGAAISVASNRGQRHEFERCIRSGNWGSSGNGLAWWPLLLLVDSCSGIRLPLVRTVYGTGKGLAVL
jgi:hypothetical protein